MKKFYVLLVSFVLFLGYANAATVIATVNGNPITDIDITSRTELMNKQGFYYEMYSSQFKDEW